MTTKADAAFEAVAAEWDKAMDELDIEDAAMGEPLLILVRRYALAELEDVKRIMGGQHCAIINARIAELKKEVGMSETDDLAPLRTAVQPVMAAAEEHHLTKLCGEWCSKNRAVIERAAMLAVVKAQQGEHSAWCRICLGGYDCERIEELERQRVALEAQG